VDDLFLERWLEEVVATPGMTGLRSVEEARTVLLADALRATPLVARAAGAVVDVGSGGGSPGIPLAVALPEREFTLLEAEGRKAAFLERVSASLPNVRVVRGRAEEQPGEMFAVALAKALAQPPVAVELCIPLLRVDGLALVWVGETADRARAADAAERLGGELEEEVDGVLVLRKVAPTPPGFPRRPGLAAKRPLA
jgi:16S rRNA (guanine527-N7)-methyltransferase